MNKEVVKNDKLFKFDDSKRIEQTFILKNSKVVKLL